MVTQTDNYSKINHLIGNNSKLRSSIVPMVSRLILKLTLIVMVLGLSACQSINKLLSPNKENQQVISSGSHTTTNQVDYNAEITKKVQTLEAKRNGSGTKTNVIGHAAEITLISPVFGATDIASSVITVGRDGKVLVWAPPGRIINYPLDVPTDALVAFHSKAFVIASVIDGMPVIYDIGTGRQFAKLQKSLSRITSLDFSPDGASLLIGGADGNVYRWNYLKALGKQTDKEQLRNFERYSGHSTSVGSVAYHPYGRVFFSGDWKGGLSAWLGYDEDPFGGTYDENIFGARFFSEKVNRKRAARNDKSSIDFLEISPNGEILALGLQTGVIELWSVRGFTKKGSVTSHAGLLYDLKFDNTGGHLATISRDGLLRVWRVVEEAATVEKPFQYNLEKIFEREFAEGRQLAFLSSDFLWVGDVNGKIHSIQVEEQ